MPTQLGDSSCASGGCGNPLFTEGKGGNSPSGIVVTGGTGSPMPDPDDDDGLYENRYPNDWHPVRRMELVEKNGVYYVRNGSKLTRAKGNYDFVRINGRTWVAGPNSGHANIARGQAVEYSGQLHFGRGTTTRGTLKSWSNQSGHYLPHQRHANRAQFDMSKFTTKRLF